MRLVYFYNKNNLRQGVLSFKVKDILYLKGKKLCTPYYLVSNYNINTCKYEEFDMWISIGNEYKKDIYEYQMSIFNNLILSFNKKKLFNEYFSDLKISIDIKEKELSELHKINIEGVNN